ncbi:unnamed protein product, partial [Cladocopium goreaui]
VDLDIKKHASIENISPSPEVAEAEAPGDAGECCVGPGAQCQLQQHRLARWIPAVVQS